MFVALRSLRVYRDTWLLGTRLQCCVGKQHLRMHKGGCMLASWRGAGRAACTAFGLLMPLASNAADLATACATSRHVTKASVVFVETVPAIEDTATAADLAAHAERQLQFRKFAYTQATLVRNVSLRLDGFSDQADGQACLWPKVEIELRFEPLRVQLARELSVNSCFRYHVLEHELTHVAIYQAAVRDGAEQLRVELDEWLQRTRFEGQAERLMAQLQQDISHQWLPRLDELINAADKRHDALDAAEEAHAYSVCNGAAALVVRAIESASGQ
jgi:hypothetical protein